ncbi:MAG TPA: hypothetical protein VNQ90_10535 [Chthoniobacteraceae bacterium]|nr:hypothetical protein [Chthoniobacteraceae bacterium]
MNGPGESSPQWLRVWMEQHAERTLEAVRVVAGSENRLFLHFQAMYDHARAQWERIATHRGLTLPTIAFVGERNSGKSYLASRLVLAPDAEKRFAPGVDEATKTERLFWVGPESPPDLAEPWEACWRLEREAMVDLGTPYLLLDSPGSGDRSEPLRALAQTALSSARIKVLVVNSERRSAEAYREAMKEADGSVIVPAVHLSAGETTRWERGSATEREAMAAEYRAWGATLAADWPSATVLEPILLPEIEAMPDPAAAGEQVRERLADALREALAAHSDTGALASRELVAAWERFRRSVGELLETILTPALHQRYGALQEARRTLPTAVMTRLLRDGAKLRALVRNRLRLSLVESVPSCAFPFRTVAKLLCLTTGAWDRLVLGLGGSLPSLALAGASLWRNVREKAAAEASLGGALKAEIESVVQQHLLGPLEDFHAAADRATHREHATVAAVEFEVEGAEALAHEWEEKLVAQAARDRLAPGVIALLSLLGTAVFWFLLGGPLLHLYGQYFPAAIASWSGEWESFSHYPLMGLSFWSMALLLAALPLFLIALVTVGIALGGRRVARSEAALRTFWLQKAEKGELGLQIRLRSRTGEAVRVLLEGLPDHFGRK